MRKSFVALVVGTVLVLPGAALAQDGDIDDICHVDPTNPICVEGADGDDGDDGADGAVDGADGADGAVDGADGAVDGADGAVDGADGAVDGADGAVAGGEAPSEVLATTGTEVGPALGVVAGLLALGGGLLFTAKRRAREQ
jgi:LPXTG-motif cell wall-anchored protein